MGLELTTPSTTIKIKVQNTSVTPKRLFVSIPSSTPDHWQPHIYFQLLQVSLHFLKCYVNTVIQYAFLFLWLLSFNLVILNFIYVIKFNHSFLFVVVQHFFMWIYLVHLCTYGWIFGFFLFFLPLLLVLLLPIMNILELSYTSLCMDISFLLGKYPEMNHKLILFNILRDLK